VRVFKVIFIGVIISVFLVGQAYSAPKGNNGKSNNSNSNNNNSQANVIKTINPRSNTGQVNRVNKSSKNKGKSALHKRKARRSSEANRKREERNRTLQHIDSDRESKTHDNASRAEEFLMSLEQARQNHDSPGSHGHSDASQVQKNKINRTTFKKGDPQKEMLANFDLRKVTNLNFRIDDSLVGTYQKNIDYYRFLIESGALTREQASYYQDRIHAYARIINRQRLKEYVTVGLVGDNTIGYRLELTTDKNVKQKRLLIETTLILQVDFVSYEYTWHERTSTWYIEGTQYYAGDEIIIQSDNVTLSGDDRVYEFNYDPEVNLISGTTGGYFDMVTTITDEETQAKVTRTADKSLYIYRDPYGKIEDSVTGQSIIGAEIIVYNADDSIVILDKAANPNAYNPQVTDATGRFAFNLRTNRKYYMVVTAPGYEDYESGVFTEKWHVIREDITLSPVKEQIASIED